MASENGTTLKDKLRFSEVINNYWGRIKVWFDWYFADPEGPPLGKFLLGFALRIFGLFFGIVGFYLLIDYGTWELLAGEAFNINYIRNIGAGFLFFGGTFYILGEHANRVEIKTAAYNEDIDKLVGEVEKYLKPTEDLHDSVKEEIKNLKRLKEKPSEVSVIRLTSLRKMQVDFYNDDDLKSQAKADLLDYKFVIGEDHSNYKHYKFIINDVICRNEIESLKGHLKTLREQIDSENFVAGQGEAILESIAHWNFPALISLFVLGVNPLLPPVDPSSYSLSFLNWGFLGITGAVIYTVHHMRERDTTIVGEDEGNLELRKMLLGMLLGGFAAIVLFLVIDSGGLAGSLFPQLNPDVRPVQTIFEINALSVFWGLAAGFSAKLFQRLVGASDE